MDESWGRIAIAGVVILIAIGIAKLVDMRISRRNLAPETATRYRVLRRAIVVAIVFIGVFSALLVIPQVRAVAGAILASSAVFAIVIGFAAQRTLGNFIAGISIAFSQPIRLGDEIQIGGTDGVVEEIGLTYTWVRTRDNDMLVIPNEKLASDTILNRTIRSAGAVAEVKVEVPLAADIRSIVSALEGDGTEVYVTELGSSATLAVRRQVAGGRSVDREESELRVAVHERLAELGALPVTE